MDFGDSDFLKEEKEDENRKIEIKDALTCFICTAKVLDPMMCPQCKKLVCTKCIKKWYIDQQHQKCPYCQVPSSFNQMITLPFMNQLSEYFIKEIEKKENMADKTYIFSKSKNMNINQIIDEDDDNDNKNNINEDDNNDEGFLSKTHLFPNKFQMNNNNNNENMEMSSIKIKDDFIIERKKKDLCPKHRNEIIEYYCVNCNTKHCSKCLLIMSNESKLHQGHKIIDIVGKNKYNLDNINHDIKTLSDTIKDLTQYKINIEIDSKLVEKKEDFYKKMVDEFQKKILSKTMRKSTSLSVDNQSIEKQLKLIENIKNNNKDAIINFVERDDKIGLEEYHQRIKDYKDINKYKHDDQYEIFIKPSLKFLETDFNVVDIMENNDNIGEVIGELNVNVEGLDKPVQLRFNQEAIDEILINIQINLDFFDEEKIDYACYFILKNKDSITSAILNEKMVHNGILILGKTIIKNSLKNIIDENNKCHVKLILAEFKL
jgi:hypothetical protein